MKKVFIGADHRGFIHKEYIKKKMVLYSWIDLGTFSKDKVDYPLIAQAVCLEMQKTGFLGVLLCGSGVGMSIAANRFVGIYAALVWQMQIVRQAKQEDNPNLLVLPADYITPPIAVALIEAWLTADFLAGQYAIRQQMIDQK